jgi:hypothetical protein
MAQYRNISNYTVRDQTTGKVVEPDSVIDISDELAEFYVGHPIFQEVGGYVPPVVAPVVVEPVVETPVVSPEPVVSPVDDEENQEEV